MRWLWNNIELIAGAIWTANYIMYQELWMMAVAVLFVFAAGIKEICDAYTRGATRGSSDDKQ